MGKEESSFAKEESLSKYLYKIVLILIKVIPILIAIIYILNTVLSYIGIDLSLFSYIVQYLFIALMYVTSYAFKFCSWHRMIIHYILTVFTLNIIDYHFTLPLSDRDLFILYSVITGIFLIITTYLKFKICRR